MLDSAARVPGRSALVLALILVAAACAGQSAPADDGPAQEPTPADAQAPATAAPEATPADPAAAPAEPAPAAVDVAGIAARLRHGIDLSHHNGAVDWAAVAAEGHTFAIVKASEGVDNPDPSFASHWPAMKAAGLIRGAYHFYVTEDDPAEQARLFTSTVELEPGDLAPAIDVEILGHDTQPGLVDRLKTFLDILEQHYGIKPILYTGPNFWNANLDATFGAYPLWIAEYGVTAPRLPVGWNEWHLWQYEDDATVAGVEKPVDMSHVNRNEVDLGVLVVVE